MAAKTPSPKPSTIGDGASAEEGKSAFLEHSKSPNDGGLIGWIQCAAGFCIFFNTWGLLNTFGVFQSYYSLHILESVPNSSISWIGTVQSSLIMLGSVYSGPLYDRGHLRFLMSAGSLCFVLGMFLTSICREYWQFMLAQGLLVGLGLGCLFVPTLGVIAAWFQRRRGIAMGISTSGSALGGILYPIIFSQLVDRLGFGWTIRVLTFIMLSLCILPVFGMRLKSKPPPKDYSFVKTLIHEADFVIFMTGTLFGYLGLYIPFFYIQLYCSETGIITDSLNFYLLPIINAGGFLGRIAIGWLADLIGPMNALVIDSGICTILVLAWIGIETKGGIIVFCFLYGFVSSGIIILPATAVSMSLCPDIRQYATRMVIGMIPMSIGLLIGNPIAGSVLSHGWTALQLVAGISLLICSVLSIIARICKVGLRIQSKC